MIQNSGRPDFQMWRDEARILLQKGVAPVFAGGGDELSLFSENPVYGKPLSAPKAPKEFLKLASVVVCARAADRWSLLYRLIYRLNHEDANLLKISVDDDVKRANELAKSVRRDIHKMHAFVRFKKTIIEGQETYSAWHKPEHLIVELGTPFFVRRFGDKPWSIFTPDASAHWDLKELTFSEGISQNEFEHTDPFDEVWKTYYKSIFNPARLKIKAMKAEMSPKYWSSLPEAEIIRELIRDVPKRLQDMAAAPQYKADVPENLSWAELKEKALGCKACPLGKLASHTIFGEGNLKADLMVVGEQPGDEEDKMGKLFIGPAGKVLNEAFARAGIERSSLYITNTVKHFKWINAGEKRIHKTASGTEMQACKPWLEAEVSQVKPKVIVALGTTAGTALYGKLMKIQKERGTPYHQSQFAKTLLLSWHPSAILRAASPEEKEGRMNELVKDLTLAWQISQNS